MTLAIKKLSRKFHYNGATLDDPGTGLALSGVAEIYSAIYPELTTATVSGPVTKGEFLVYTFEVAAGTKG